MQKSFCCEKKIFFLNINTFLKFLNHIYQINNTYNYLNISLFLQLLFQMEECTIIDNSYLVGPGVRIAVYIQSILGFIKILTKGQKASANLGALTSFCL